MGVITTPRATEPRLMTAEEFFALPGDDRAELVNGVVVMVPPASHTHGSVNSRLLSRLAAHVYGGELGEVYDSSTGFLLRRGPDVVRAPDVAFVSAARVPLLQQGRPGSVVLAPDLVVETLSPSNTASEMQRKTDEYLRHGTRLVWVIDPDERTAAVYTSDAPVRWLGEGDALEGGDVVPGFSVPLAFVFAGLGPRS